MIQELMVINNAGIALFYHNFINNEKKDDHQSLASYFDIICRFTKHSFKESLRMLTLDSFIFYFYTHISNYYLVLKCDNKRLNKDLLENIAETIIDNFLNEYEELLKDFNGEISSFNSFSQIVEHIVSLKLGDIQDIIPIEH
ncbi:MAG: hypothetical protein ACFFFB_21825 [Candidatus Heimdallarchaeota archaeon]